MKGAGATTPQGVTVQQFFLGLVRSGALTADDLRALREQYPPSLDQHDAQLLARDLVTRAKLSPYQASALYQNRFNELLVGPFRIVDRLRSSSSGSVFDAVYVSSGNRVELKVVSDVGVSSERELTFQREAQQLASLLHLTLPAVVDFGVADGRGYVATQPVVGNDLRSLVKTKGPINVNHAINYIVQAAKGLAYAHSRGLIHRHLNPASIVVGAAKQIKLLDLGLPSFDEPEPTLDEAAADATADHSSETGFESRNIDYMAPEQMVSASAASTRADIYSLGCILHRLITSRRPYSGDSNADKLQAHREQPLPSLRVRRKEVPELLDKIFRRMLAKRPEDRQQSMQELVDELERTLLSAEDALPPSTPVPTMAERAEQLSAAIEELELTAPRPQDTPQPPSGHMPLDAHPGMAGGLEMQPLWSSSNPAGYSQPNVDVWGRPIAPQPSSPQTSAPQSEPHLGGVTEPPRGSVAERAERRSQIPWVKAIVFIFVWIIGGVLGLAIGYMILLEIRGRDADYLELWPYWLEYRQPVETPPPEEESEETTPVRRNSAKKPVLTVRPAAEPNEPPGESPK